MLAHETPSIGVAAKLAANVQGLIPQLETTRLVLRAPRIDDFQAYVDIVDGPGGRFIIDNDAARDDIWYDFTQMTAGWTLRGHGLWTCVTKDTGTITGFVVLGFEPGDLEPELGYMFLENSRGQGLATEAARAAKSFAFDQLGFITLVSCIDPENAPSIALAERLGGIRDPEAEAQHNGTYIYRYTPTTGGLS